MKITIPLRIPTSKVAAPIVIALLSHSAVAGGLTEADKIFREVMTACNYKNVDDALIFVTATPMGKPFATPEQEAKYIADEANFKRAQRQSPCWTRGRWERYVHAVVQADRVKFGKN